MTPAELNDIVKTQNIRIADVVFIGPLMIWGGLQLRDAHPVRGTALALLGVSTILYNARNYHQVQTALTA
jgi:hypothetical protein